MFPVMLDLKRVTVLLAARGEHHTKRRAQLAQAGATSVREFNNTLPQAADFQGVQLVLAAGLAPDESERIAQLARANNILVNVEDVIEQCDFFYPAIVRRGDLLLAVSTCGASPTLAQEVRKKLERDFTSAWKERTQELKTLRQQWRAQGKSMRDVGELTRAHIRAQGWLPDPPASEAA